MNQENSALVPANYDDLPRETKKTTDTTFDRIYKYYHNSKTRIELSSEEIKIRERWEKAWLLMSRHRTKKQVVDLIEKLFHVAKSVAYDDVRKASMLFSDPQADLKEAKRGILEDMILRGADKCWKKGDMDGYHKFAKMYADINKLDIPDNDLFDIIKKLKPTQVLIVSSAADLEANANALQEGLTNDIPYTEAE
jgi:hypothetical protein